MLRGSLLKASSHLASRVFSYHCGALCRVAPSIGAELDQHEPSC